MKRARLHLSICAYVTKTSAHVIKQKTVNRKDRN